ncbi:MAG: N-acetylglucosamine-6-phosphate deacetylase [Propionibacteriaceae bacterium]|nr:N-acetylglucosamine-6-phosphate deacetylase [Propionibacteriaceae bacterium]
MMRLRAARVFTGTEMLTPGEIGIEGDRVVAVGPPTADQAIDLGDVTLAPGLVDAHSHGGGGFAFPDDVDAVLAAHRVHGTTTMIASTVTQSLDELERQVTLLAERVRDGSLAGIHLEGPWLAEKYKGAHPVDKLRDPLVGEVQRLLDAGDGAVKMVTIAVEKPGALESVQLMAERGVVAALGHTACTYDEAVAAIDAGVTGATHLFNAMPGLHHREPGPILALLEDDRVWCELIVDGVHLRPELAAWVMSVSDRVVLVTDAMAATGCADGDYVLGDLPVVVDQGVAKIAGTDTIAGSTLVLSRGVQVAISAGVTPQVALQAATLNPARYLGLDDVGEFVPGARADAVVFGSDWSVDKVLYRGEWL